jgi:hypothetical protein
MWYFDPMLKGMVAWLSASGFAAQAAIQPGKVRNEFDAHCLVQHEVPRL